MWTNETEESDAEVTPACGGVEVGRFAILSIPAIWKVDRVSSKTAEAPEYGCAVWRQ